VQFELKCRQEDVRYRDICNRRRDIQYTRRQVADKTKMLRALLQASVLIMGFAIVVLTNIDLPGDLPIAELILYAFSGSATISCMMLCALSTTMIFIAITRYDTVERNPPFEVLWNAHCQKDWRFSVGMFSSGIISFFLVTCFSSPC
jgi:hypothetical protein